MRVRTTHYSHVAIRHFRYPDSPICWFYVETTPERGDTSLHSTISSAYKEVQAIHTYCRLVFKNKKLFS